MDALSAQVLLLTCIGNTRLLSVIVCLIKCAQLFQQTSEALKLLWENYLHSKIFWIKSFQLLCSIPVNSSSLIRFMNHICWLSNKGNGNKFSTFIVLFIVTYALKLPAVSHTAAWFASSYNRISFRATCSVRSYRFKDLLGT